MKNILKKALPNFLNEMFNSCISKKRLADWYLSGRPNPVPHLVKISVINYYKEKYKINVLVETGTYLGDMVKAQLNNFSRIYSVELSLELWKKAAKRFKNDKHVRIIQGDSGKCLWELVPEINERAIFWLDGHYSAGATAKGDKDCPIIEELGAIFTTGINHILLIDDARLFVGVDDYPTINELTSFILSHFTKSIITIDSDIICVELA